MRNRRSSFLRSAPKNGATLLLVDNTAKSDYERCLDEAQAAEFRAFKSTDKDGQARYWVAALAMCSFQLEGAEKNPPPEQRNLGGVIVNLAVWQVFPPRAG